MVYEAAVQEVSSALGNQMLVSEQKVERTYVPRKIHLDYKAAHLIIGVASHLAWKALIMNKQTSKHALRVPFQSHVALTGEIDKAIINQMLASLSNVRVTIGTQKTGTITLTEDFSGVGSAAGGATIKV